MRRARTIDARRLAQALAPPALTWVSPGRVDDDPEALTFDPGVGWIVDVTFYGSGLEDDTGRPCRILSAGAPGAGRGEYLPPVKGAEALVVVPAGDPEAGPVVVGWLTNEEDAQPPATVNGLPIVADLLASTPVTVSPYDTEIVSSPHNRRQDYGGAWVLDSADIRLGGDTGLELALRGETTVANTNELLQALAAFAAALIPLPGALAPLGPIGQQLADALLELAPKIAAQLAERVRVR